MSIMSGTGMSAMNTMNQTMMTEEERARADARKIGPFSFDQDNDIDTEVLDNE